MGDGAMRRCYDNIRFALSDRTGRIAFESFDIVDMPECHDLAARLRQYLVHRPLAQVDVKRIRSMRGAVTAMCISDVARALDELKYLFGAPAAPNPASGLETGPSLRRNGCGDSATV